MSAFGFNLSAIFEFAVDFLRYTQAQMFTYPPTKSKFFQSRTRLVLGFFWVQQPYSQFSSNSMMLPLPCLAAGSDRTTRYQKLLGSVWTCRPASFPWFWTAPEQNRLQRFSSPGNILKSKHLIRLFLPLILNKSEEAGFLFLLFHNKSLEGISAMINEG